jgi:Rrf2 family protein
MFTKTVILAIRALLVVVKNPPGAVISPRNVAAALNESPAYMAKVLRMLVKAGILRAERGVKGGVFLGRRTSEIALLEIVEACQGAIHGSYCQPIDDLRTTCAFHRAAVELEQAMVGVLSRWTLAQIEKSPAPAGRLPGLRHCLMTSFPVAIAATVAAKQRKGSARP